MATYRKIKDISQFEPVDKKKNRKKWLIGILVAVLTVGVILGAWAIVRPETFRGKKNITVEIHHSDGYVETFRLRTNRKFLSEVLIDEDLADTENGPYGLYITAAGRVGKEVAIYEQNNAYWAVYVGDSYAQQGISQLPIEEGKTYKLKFCTE